MSKLGARVESPNFEFKEDDDSSWMHEAINAVFNENERRTNRRQVIQKQRARLELGYWLFAAKRGYKMEKTALYGKYLVPSEPDASLVRNAFEKFASGEFQTKVDACRYLFTAAFSRGNSGRIPYYLCQNKECEVGRKSVRRDDVHGGFDEILKNQTIREETVELLKVVFDRVWDQETYALKENESVVRSQIEKLEVDLDQYAESAVTAKNERLKSIYERKAEECDAEIESLRSELVGSTDLSILYRTALEKATGVLKSPYKIWHSVDVHEKYKLFHFIFLDKLPYSKKAGYRTDNLPSAVRLFEEFVSTNSQDVEMGGVEPPSELVGRCESTMLSLSLDLKSLT